MSFRKISGVCVEEQILAETPLLLRDGCESLELFRIDDHEIDAYLRVIVEQNRNDGLPGTAEAEADVPDAKSRLDIRDLLLDESD